MAKHRAVRRRHVEYGAVERLLVTALLSKFNFRTAIWSLERQKCRLQNSNPCLALLDLPIAMNGVEQTKVCLNLS